MFDVLKKALTSYINVKLNKGYGVTVDDHLVLDEEQANRTIQSVSPSSCKYKLSSEAGIFEFDSMVRLKSGVNMYQIRHIATGTCLVLPKHLFTLLFDKI